MWKLSVRWSFTYECLSLSFSFAVRIAARRSFNLYLANGCDRMQQESERSVRRTLAPSFPTLLVFLVLDIISIQIALNSSQRSLQELEKTRVMSLISSNRPTSIRCSFDCSSNLKLLFYSSGIASLFLDLCLCLSIEGKGNVAVPW